MGEEKKVLKEKAFSEQLVYKFNNPWEFRRFNFLELVKKEDFTK